MDRKKLACAILGAIGVAAVSASPAMACGSGKILFEDKFEKLDPAWGMTLGDGWTTGPEGLKMVLKPNDAEPYLNQTSLYDDYEVCMTVTAEFTGDDFVDPYVMFWGSDSDNYYEAGVGPHYGKYSVFRKQRGKWLSPVAWTESPAVRKGSGAQNEVSVVVQGNHAIISINGEKVTEFTGQAPDGGSQIGIDGDCDKDNKNPCTIIFKDIQVRALK